MPTDRRAANRVWNWGGLALTYDDKLLMGAALTLPARYRRHPEDWPRLRWYARRLAIARRRQRIAAQPRVGDHLWCDPDAIVAELVVTHVDDELVWTDERDHEGRWWRSSWIRDEAPWPLEWRELVRRAQMTQEAA